MYRTRFTVEGRGTFPLDMLRYDACFPRTPEAVVKMKGDSNAPTRSVDLLKHHKTKDHPNITPQRWGSFGWGVLTIGEPTKVRA